MKDRIAVYEKKLASGRETREALRKRLKEASTASAPCSDRTTGVQHVFLAPLICHMKSMSLELTSSRYQCEWLEHCEWQARGASSRPL